MRWFLLLLLTISSIHAYPSVSLSSIDLPYETIKRHTGFPSPILRNYPLAAFSGSDSNALLLDRLYLPYGTPLDRIPSRPSSRLI